MKKLVLLALPWATLACGEGGLDPETDVERVYGREEAAEEEGDDAGATAEPEFVPSAGHRSLSERDEAPAESVPPGEVERPSYVDSSGFFVLEGRLYDKYGNPFVMRGLNNAHAWFDTAGRNLAIGALDDIAGYGFNTVRIVWQTEEANPDATVGLLHQIIDCIVELQMIPMLELHDVTGVPQGIASHIETGELRSWQSIADAGLDFADWERLPAERANEVANEALLDMAHYFTREDVKDVLLAYEDYVLINIANEWSGEDYFGGYSAAIEHLRGEGLHHTLVLDANGWGQNADVLLAEGQRLLDFDPQHNLLFSTHMYERFSDNAEITRVLEAATEQKLPFIVGEFGPEHAGESIDVEFIFAESERLGTGYLAWSWKGNSGDLVYLDMAVDWEGEQLTEWGEAVVLSPNGVANTSERASIFAF